MSEILEDSDLAELMNATSPIIDRLQGDYSFAALTLGVRTLEDPKTKQIGMLTIISAAGLYSVLEEGLYAELASQIEEGNRDLFITIRNAIKAVEKDFDIDTTEEISHGNPQYLN